VSDTSAASRWFTEGLVLHRQGMGTGAEHFYLTALSADPGHAPTLMQLGALRLQQGRFNEAVRLTREALLRIPADAEGHSNLATAFYMLGQHAEAVAAYEEALLIDPNRAEAYYGLGLASHALRRYEEAAACQERALTIDPDYAEASCALGTALTALTDYRRAVAAFNQALEIDPDYAEALCGLAEAMHAQKRSLEAIDLYRRSLELRPDHPETLNVLAVTLQAVDRHDEAIALFRHALSIKPDFGDALLHLGIALEESGQIDAAAGAFEKALTIDPDNLHYCFAAANIKPVRDNDTVVRSLASIKKRSDILTEDEAILFHFSYAKVLSDLTQQKEAFAHLVSGNTLKRRSLSYDEIGTLRAIDQMQALFTPRFMARFRGAGHQSDLPVFIVGMPRSGSTLVEQMLASHRNVFGGGERSDFTAAMQEAGLDISHRDFFSACSDLDNQQLKHVGENYIRRLVTDTQTIEHTHYLRVTDKMLANYCFIGLIHLALPNARIIHIRRDPIDTALSCFSKLFAADVPYTYDLGEFGRYYRSYVEMMNHWRVLLSPDTIIDVDYEQIVFDFESNARRIVSHCGLVWDEACLNFHTTRRLVKTASATQVRRPIYQSSIARWRVDQDLLQPLYDALQGAP